MRYPGLFNSSYVPSKEETLIIDSPQNHIGPLLIAQISTTLLQGVLLVQYYEYVSGPKDQNKWNRWLVHVIAGLAMLKSAYVWWLAWDRLISHYGNWAYLTIFNPLSIPADLLNTVPNAICQVFYIQRGWMLSKNKYFVWPALFFLAIYLGSGIALTCSTVMSQGGRVVITKLSLISATASTVSGLLCTIFITGFTCWYLVKEMTGTKKTDSVVRKVVLISIESATGPTISVLLGLILTNRATNNQWFLIPALMTSYTYSCSLLYSVNSRKRLNGLMGNTITSNLFQTRDTQAPPTQLIIIDGTFTSSESSGDQIELSHQRNTLLDEADKLALEEELSQATTDGTLAAERVSESNLSS